MAESHSSDEEILARIRELVDAEGDLHHADRGQSPEEASQEQRIEVALDRCWDLLRQRRARRSAGQDPEDAELREAGTVEGYLS